MADTKKLVWDETGSRLYETGVSQCALYVQTTGGAYGKGVAWNGITGITESPSGAEASPQYADNIKYLNLISAEEFGICRFRANPAANAPMMGSRPATSERKAERKTIASTKNTKPTILAIKAQRKLRPACESDKS